MKKASTSAIACADCTPKRPNSFVKITKIGINNIPFRSIDKKVAFLFSPMLWKSMFEQIVSG